MNDAKSPQRAWIVAIPAEYALHAVGQRMIQINDGKRGNVARLGQDDGLVIYSPTDQFRGKTPLRAFTQIGTVVDEKPYQAPPMDMGPKGTVAPWRREIDWEPAVRSVAVAEVGDELLLTRTPNWGYPLRFGLAPLDCRDYARLRTLMAGRA